MRHQKGLGIPGTTLSFAVAIASAISTGFISAAVRAEGTGGVEGKTQLPKLVPWIELNTIREDAFENAVGGLLIWQKITDTAIVSTVPGYAHLYTKLRARVPGMHIIPGMKTSRCLPALDSVAGWKEVARAVNEVCEAAGEKRVVLENEGAIQPFWREGREIDEARLREGLRELPEAIEIIWYPSIVGETQEARRRSVRLTELVAEVEGVRFTDLSISGPKSLRYGWSKLGRKQLKEIAERQVIPMLYCYGPGSRWWEDEDIPEALKLVEGDFVILYPGSTRWREAARSITKIISEHNGSDSP